MEINIKNLPKSAEELAKIILLQQQEIEKNKQEIISHKERYIRLLEEFKLEKSRIYGASSEKNIYQSDLFDEAGIDLVDELKDQLEDTIDVDGYKRKVHPVRKSIPKNMPREVLVYDIPEHEKICGCGAHLVRIGESITEQIKYIPAKLSMAQHVRPKYACKPCQGNVKIAPMPRLLLPKSLATPELVAYTIVTKYCDHIPLYRQQNIWDRLGIDMPHSSLCGWLLKVSELCEPLVKLLRYNIIVYDYAQADETSVQVLDEIGRSNKSKSYIWCYRGGGIKPCIVYEYQETRGGYNFADKDDGIIRVGCMAHARRKFADIIKISKTDGLAHDAIKYFKALYKIEKETRESNASPLSLYRFALRDEKAKPILTAFKTWLDTNLTKIPVQSKIGEAIRYTIC